MDRPQAVADSIGEQHGIGETPADGDILKLGSGEVRWKYYRCQLDHLVNVPAVCATPQALFTLGYLQVRSSAEQNVNFVLTTSAPMEMWVNGQLCYCMRQFPEAYLQAYSFPVGLHEGVNEVLVRATDVSMEYSAVRFALRLVDLAALEVEIVLPTHAEQPKRQQRLEQILEYAYLEDVVNHRGAHFNVRWADGIDENAVVAYQIQDAKEAIYVDGKGNVAQKVIDVGQEYRLYERPYWVVLKAVDVEYYGQNLRYQRALPIHVLDTAFSTSPYGSFYQRRQEALKDATKHEASLYAQIAHIELGQWEKVNPKAIRAAIERAERHEFDSVVDLLGLLLILYRYAANPAFPAELIRLAETCIPDSLDTTPVIDESQHILHLVCEILAGQRYPDVIFSASGKPGTWHKANGEQAALDWMLQRGRAGFAAWDSNSEFEWIVAALAQLASLVENDGLRDLATVLLDKVFFTMAINSFKGAYVSSHGKTRAGMLKSAQLEATSGIMSMMWGMGVFNHHIVGTVSLACSKYEFPLFIGEIANDLSTEMWNRERHQLAAGEVHKVVYRTADYFLASAQDYRPGQPGKAEHIWQASFGPEAVVFVTHPACMSEHEANQPGFWLGNAVLPRVAQWKDVLLAIHNLPDDDWMGFTHAYFPIYAFEAYAIDKTWAFARVGNGYLALSAANGLDWIKHAPDGHRELRSYGKENIWLCHMGSAVQDGSFSEFQAKIKATKLEWNGLAVTLTSLRSERISFGWQQPLKINDQEQPLADFKHYENPYATVDFPASSMEIHFQEIVMRLSFE